MKRASALWLLLAACSSPAGELHSLADLPPLDYAVLITGEALVDAPPGQSEAPLQRTFTAAADGTAFPLLAMVDVLQQGQVFRRLGVDRDPVHRRQLLAGLPGDAGSADAATLQFLQRARDDGYDWLLVVERLQDGPIDAQGVNGRWPLTLATWFLLGVGMLIPDHTFESRATLRVTLRDLQHGRVVHELLRDAGPVDLSLIERSNFLGLLTHIVVPPFWVGDDDEHVRDEVRSWTERRLLLSVARDFKSEPVRQVLRQRAWAAFDLERDRTGLWLRVDAREHLTALRLRQGQQPLAGPQVEALQAALLGSLQRDGERFLYRARIDLPLSGEPLQVMVLTLVGNVASATLEVPGAR